MSFYTVKFQVLAIGWVIFKLLLLLVGKLRSLRSTSPSFKVTIISRGALTNRKKGWTRYYRKYQDVKLDVLTLEASRVSCKVSNQTETSGQELEFSDLPWQNEQKLGLIWIWPKVSAFAVLGVWHRRWTRPVSTLFRNNVIIKHRYLILRLARNFKNYFLLNQTINCHYYFYFQHHCVFFWN